MKKKIIINEEQYLHLVKAKKDEKLAKKIVNELKTVKFNLNETKYLNSGLNDVIIKYKRKGYLTEGVINQLKKMNIKINQTI